MFLLIKDFIIVLLGGIASAFLDNTSAQFTDNLSYYKSNKGRENETGSIAWTFCW